MTEHKTILEELEINIHKYIVELLKTDSITINTKLLAALYNTDEEKIKDVVNKELDCVKNAYLDLYKETIKRIDEITAKFQKTL